MNKKQLYDKHLELYGDNAVSKQAFYLRLSSGRIEEDAIRIAKKSKGITSPRKERFFLKRIFKLTDEREKMLYSMNGTCREQVNQLGQITKECVRFEEKNPGLVYVFLGEGSKVSMGRGLDRESASKDLLEFLSKFYCFIKD